MLHQLGPRRSQPETLVDMLLDCHARIRSFIALAGTAARERAASEEEIAEACRAVEVYFREALPLHVEDEEQSILPRLQGQTPSLDACLALMHREHGEHVSQLDALLAACAQLRSQPRDAQGRARLEACAQQLAADFERHLALEEGEVFTAVGNLAPALQSAIIAEIRERRRPPR